MGRPPRDYLLTGGLAVCGLCTAPLRARPRADKVRSYVCVAEARQDGSRPCGGVRCVAEPLEELVFDAVLVDIGQGALERVLRSGDDDADQAGRVELLAQLAESERKLGQAEERYLEGDVSHRSFIAVRNRHRSMAEEARRQLARMERERLLEYTPRSADELRKWWPDTILTQKRAFLRLFLEHVTVKPAPHRGARFTEKRVEFTWLH